MDINVGYAVSSTVLSLAFTIVTVIGMWKMFEKADEPGWKSLIPFYNLYIIFKIVYGNGWKFLLLIVPILGFVMSIAYCIRIAHVFGKGTGFGILCVLFMPIMVCVIGFGSAEYEGPIDSFL